jgi:hypothetical protein
MFFDDVSHKIDLGLAVNVVLTVSYPQSMRSATPALKKVEQAAAAWQKQIQGLIPRL